MGLLQLNWWRYFKKIESRHFYWIDWIVSHCHCNRSDRNPDQTEIIIWKYSYENCVCAGQQNRTTEKWRPWYPWRVDVTARSNARNARHPETGVSPPVLTLTVCPVRNRCLHIYQIKSFPLIGSEAFDGVPKTCRAEKKNQGKKKDGKITKTMSSNAGKWLTKTDAIVVDQLRIRWEEKYIDSIYVYCLTRSCQYANLFVAWLGTVCSWRIGKLEEGDINVFEWLFYRFIRLKNEKVERITREDRKQSKFYITLSYVDLSTVPQLFHSLFLFEIKKIRPPNFQIYHEEREKSMSSTRLIDAVIQLCHH